jgi:hypothetical protein
MKQELLDSDNERDDGESINFSGIQLYRTGMNLVEGNWFTVRYDLPEKRQSAVSGCSNKCRLTKMKNVLTVTQWEDEEGIYVTVKKAPRYGNVDEAKLCKKLRKGIGSSDILEMRKERNLQLDAVDGGFDFRMYLGKTEAELDAEAVEKLSAEQVEFAIRLLSKGKSDEVMLELGVSTEDLAKAKEKVAEKEQRFASLVLPGAADDWDKTTWTLERVRGDENLFDRIKHARKTWGVDPIIIAEKQHISKEVAAVICDEVDAAIEAERKEANKKVLASKKALNPEKYQPKVTETGNETA